MDIFGAGEFSWNYGTLISIRLQHKKEKPGKEKITEFFAWKLLKSAF